MPSRVNGNAGSRFELPALDLNFGSITDGTDIPPPEKEHTPPPTPRADAKPAAQDKAVTKTEPTLANKPVVSNEGQQSNGNGADTASVHRPMSRGANSVMDDRKSKRSSGWFKRFTGEPSGKRSGLSYEEGSTATGTQSRQPAGPPPPMIPELKELEKEDTGFGSDLFKNIK